MFARLFALPCFFLVCLMALLPITPAQAAGLPSLLNGSAKTQPEAQEPLENDQ